MIIKEKVEEVVSKGTASFLNQLLTVQKASNLTSVN